MRLVGEESKNTIGTIGLKKDHGSKKEIINTISTKGKNG